MDATNRRVRACWCGLLLWLWPAVAGADYTPGLHVDEMVTMFVPRFYDVYVPQSYTGATPMPLVIDIHGLASNKTQQRLFSGFAALSEAEDFIVAYPQALHGDPSNPEAPFPPGVLCEDSNPPDGFCDFDGTTPVLGLEDAEGPSWNAGDHCCGKALEEDTQDVSFIVIMIAAILTEGNIDSERIYVTGLSNGGALTRVMACSPLPPPFQIIAAAPVSFPGAFEPLTDCMPDHPVAMIAFQSVTDEIVPYLGGHLLGNPLAPIVESAQTTFEFWRDTEGCAGTTPDTSEDIGLGNSCDRYEQCDGGVAVELCSLTVPAALWGHVAYINDNGLNVAERAWAFMSQHSLSGPITPPQVPALMPAAEALLGAVLAGGGILAARRQRRPFPKRRTPQREPTFRKR